MLQMRAYLFVPRELVVKYLPAQHYLIYLKKNFNVYSFLRERETKRQRDRETEGMSGARAEREGDTESKAGSRL